MRNLSFIAAAFAAAAVTLDAAPALAHVGLGPQSSFTAGFVHPLSGLDHVLAMVAVGLWAAMLGGRAVWIVPATFVAAMAVGFGLATAGVDIPFVEPAILASVVALGLIIAAAVEIPVAAGVALVGLFALFHGHAHAAEMGSAAPLTYAFGFALATAQLHAAGAMLGLSLGSRLAFGAAGGRVAARSLGGLTTLLGIALFIGIV